MQNYRSLSMWHDTLEQELDPRPALPDSTLSQKWDVVIMGAGYTGLWSALALKESRPELRILILEKEIAGFGASGRNGGWCSALFPSSTSSLIKRHGHEAASALRQAMVQGVDSVGHWAHRLGIDCDFVAGGTMMLARNDVQEQRAKKTLLEASLVEADHHRWLEAPDALQATGVRGAVFDPACARIHPTKLVRGLARAVEDKGVFIAERTEVLDYRPGVVSTSRGEISTDVIVDALEGYRSQLSQTKRHSLPLYSLMIATEPLPDSVFDEIGLTHGMTFSDFRSLIIYGQRTADNRIAFGGRGAPYHFGSAIRAEYDRVPRVFDALERTLKDMFPAVAEAQITHTWGGVLGVPRDWHSSVVYDSKAKIARAGGYVGDGVGLSHVAGFALADLVLGEKTPRTSLAFVDHHSPAWEPEPLRYLGAMSAIIGVGLADRIESRTGRPSLVSALIAPLTGH
jgi:glycine/D-amino acid oxidase-like deaminating enzyme